MVLINKTQSFLFKSTTPANIFIKKKLSRDRKMPADL